MFDRLTLTKEGAVQLDGNAYLARRTADDLWMVTEGPRLIGYADDLDTAHTMAEGDFATLLEEAEEEARAEAEAGDENGNFYRAPEFSSCWSD